MASRQVLKLCKRLENELGLVCKPETFFTERSKYSFDRWSIEIDIDKSTGLTELELKYFGNVATCSSPYTLADILRYKKFKAITDLDMSDISLYGVG